MKKINLIYWDSDNFGDALNPVLIEELSGLKTQFKDITLSKQMRFIILVKSLLKLRFEEANSILWPWQRSLTAVGSIISWAKKKSDIWGSGFMNSTDDFRGGETFAVRGRLTNQKLQKLGFIGCPVYGDPALLLPLWLKPAVEKKHALGLIPHWREVDYFKEKYGGRYFIIDLRTSDIEKVIENITSCEYILSTSLHGVIVGHAYDIPSLWIKHGDIETDGFKFHDYFSSVDIPLYQGFEEISEILGTKDSWRALFAEHIDKTIIKTSLRSIQVGLLKVAPFPLRDKYRSLLN